MSSELTPITPDVIAARAQAIFSERLQTNRSAADRLFAVLMILQWMFGVGVALWISPTVWAGDAGRIHPHVWAAVLLGGAITCLPVLSTYLRPGATVTRHVIAVAQMLWSALLIHLTGGRIETHFHVFGSLAFLAWYRDWKVLVTATVVVAADHLLRGIYWPLSVYGVLTAAPWRTLEHGAWVIFEDVFLLVSIRQSVREMQAIALHQADLLGRNDVLQQYTHALETAKQTLTRQARELVRQAESLQTAQAAAEQASRLKSEFLANMSHEIRTPMTAIIGFADLLADQATTAEQTDAIETIRHNGEFLLEIINGILDLSKIEAGQMQTQKFRCLPHQIVAEVASLMRVRAAAKGLTLDVEHFGPIPEIIETDPVALRQILLNLVGNAVKFTERGGVRIVTRMAPGGGDPRLLFDVIDSGIGLTSAQAEQLFRPFVQADSSMSRKYGGTGLGLAISKRLAELLGGSIELISEHGVGSTFQLTVAVGSLEGIRMLDRISEASLPTRRSTSPREDVRLDCRVLLAEDGPHNQRFLTLFLNKAGAEVTLADNGETAVELALQAAAVERPFDVILMDMQMPTLDGYAATKELRARGYEGAIIALTAHAMSDDRQKCLAAGCDDYASKPIERADLIALVARHVQQARRRAETVAGR